MEKFFPQLSSILRAQPNLEASPNRGMNGKSGCDEREEEASKSFCLKFSHNFPFHRL
jgi:hypothetical protein